MATNPQACSLELETRGSGNIILETQNDSMSLSIREQEWEVETKAFTRSEEMDPELVWKMDAPLVSLYIADTNGNLLKGNVPYNAQTKTIYKDWHSVKDGYESGTNMNGASNPEDVEQVNGNSNFFWTTWKNRPVGMPDNVNFYGFCPRPSEGGTQSSSLYYKPTSIVDRASANKTAEDWNILNFTFSAIQTIDNLYAHDVMFSIPEYDTDVADRHGNLNKKSSDNIQMHFEHAFCKLDITVINGNYPIDDKFTGRISSIKLSGNEVYTAGKINIGTLTEGETRLTDLAKGEIERQINDTENNAQFPFHTSMIMMPCTVSDQDDMKITCVVDGMEYTCPIYSSTGSLEFRPGKQYSLELTLEPEGTVILRVWAKGQVKLTEGSTETSYEKENVLDNLDFDKEYPFEVSAENGYEVIKVTRNGEELPATRSVYTLKREKGRNIFYDVVVIPAGENAWYKTEGLRIHFDGLQHDRYYLNDGGAPEKSVTWSDLSGNLNDGNLKAFDFNTNSGWNNGGLKFDGDNDLVTFPGKVNPTAYTMSFLIRIEPNNNSKSMHYRLNAEGISYPSYYVSTSNNSPQLAIFGHGVDQGLGVPANVSGTTYNPIGDTGKTAQYDFVYEVVDGKGYVSVYVNRNFQRLIGGDAQGRFQVGENAGSLDIVSLGGRIEDNSRSLKGTYYSYMLYDKALTPDEITHNYKINQKRYPDLSLP